MGAEKEKNEAKTCTNVEIALSARIADLERSNEALRSFNHHVAHDLRAPLRAVVTASRILVEDFGRDLPNDAVRLLQRQADSARRLADLVDDLLQYARLTQENARREAVDLSALAHEAAADVRGLYPERAVRIEVADALRARADPRLVRLILLNLVENAVKFSPPGVVVTVGGDRETFWVRDQGVGIDAADLGRVFEPFERLNRPEPGTGIGLANVRRAVALHGGRVWAESATGVGTTFLFTLE